MNLERKCQVGTIGTQKIRAKSTTMKKSIYNFELRVNASIPDKSAIIQALNLFWLNDKYCNIADENGHFVAKYPFHKNIKKLTNSHHNASLCHTITIKMGVDKDGNIFQRK